jgi:uncharacterized Zn finger protein
MKLPCPICGHNPVYRNVYESHILTCYECGMMNVSACTKSQSTIQWNKLVRFVDAKIKGTK